MVCEHKTPEGGRYCVLCGVLLGHSHCSQCGGEISSEYVFCPECGADLQLADSPRDAAQPGLYNLNRFMDDVRTNTVVGEVATVTQDDIRAFISSRAQGVD